MEKTAKVAVVGLLATLFIFGACSVGSEHSDKNLTELLETDADELTEAEYDKLNLLTGSMSPEEYAAKYPDDPFLKDLVDGIAGWIWGKWEKVDIPGAYCSNGSGYKIFVMKSKGFVNWLKGNTNKLLVYFEGGGACWDYPSCSGQGGIRGAANPNGIPDNYMNVGDYILGNGGSIAALMSPLILRHDPLGDNVETANWNKVFMPYCTGDVFSGNQTNVYQDDESGQTVTYMHNGVPNTEQVITYLKEHFNKPDHLMVTGSSAGGVGALTNYGLLRQELNPGKGILLNDSGPIFPADVSGGYQFPLHQKIKDVWNADYLVDKLTDQFPGFDFTGDLGQIHSGLAEFFPKDKIAFACFKRDLIFSDYSYGRFYDLDFTQPADKEEILRMWAEDMDSLLAVYDGYPNAHYYIPYYREFLDSHTAATLNWTGTEIQADGVDIGHFIDDLLKKPNANIVSREEADNPDDEDVTDLWHWLINNLAGSLF